MLPKLNQKPVSGLAGIRGGDVKARQTDTHTRTHTHAHTNTHSHPHTQILSNYHFDVASTGMYVGSDMHRQALTIIWSS